MPRKRKSVQTVMNEYESKEILRMRKLSVFILMVCLLVVTTACGEDLTSELQAATNDIENLKTENTQLQTTVSALEAENQELAKQLSEAQAQIENLSEVTTENEDTVEEAVAEEIEVEEPKGEEETDIFASSKYQILTDGIDDVLVEDDFSVTIVGAQYLDDYFGDPALEVVFSFQNNSSDPLSLIEAVEMIAFQDGISSGMSYDNEAFRQVKDGASLEYSIKFLIFSDSPMEVFVNSYYSDNNSISEVFAIS